MLNRYFKRAALSLLSVIIIACSSGGGSDSSALDGNADGNPVATPTPSDSPNILLIIADDLGLDASGQYSPGAQAPITPTLDTLAAGGLIFENLWVNPTCSPTRANMLTGRYSFRTGVISPGNILDTTEQSIQAYLTDNTPTEYSNAVVGKWHLDPSNADHPNQLGVDFFAGSLGGSVNSYTSWQKTTNGVTTRSSVYATSELVNLSIDWIDQQTTPWFLWLAFNAPHTPFHLPPANLHTRSLSGTAADIDANPIGYYFAAIEAMDTEIGRLLDGMNPDDRANTIIFFVGDNGSPARVAQYPFSRTKAKDSLYQGGINTPMFVSGPGVRAGERDNSLINGTDFFATIAEIAGIDVPVINDSSSFANRLGDASAPTRDFVYSEKTDEDSGVESWSIRDTRYKLIQQIGGDQELYDLENDPFEFTELIAAGADVSAIIQTLEDAAASIRL